MADLTAADVEKLVVTKGCPETIIVPPDDFLKIYQVYRNVNRDDNGAYVQALNTKIRLKTEKQGDNKLVDLGDSKISVFEPEVKADGAKK